MKMKLPLAGIAALLATTVAVGTGVDLTGFVVENVEDVRIDRTTMKRIGWVRVEQMAAQDFDERPGCAVRLNLGNDELDELSWCSGSGAYRNLFGLRCNHQDRLVRRAADRMEEKLTIAHVKRWAVMIVIDPTTYLRRFDGEKICMIRRVWLRPKG